MKKIAGIFKSDDMQGQLRYSGAINALKKHNLLQSEKICFGIQQRISNLL